MCSEVDNSIGIKTIASPKIGCDISMRGSHISAMNDFEIIISNSGGCLRNEYDVAELESCKGKISVLGLKTMTGELAINSSDFFRHFFTKVFCNPFFIF